MWRWTPLTAAPFTHGWLRIAGNIIRPGLGGCLVGISLASKIRFVWCEVLIHIYKAACLKTHPGCNSLSRARASAPPQCFIVRILCVYSQRANLGKSERSVSIPWPVAPCRGCPLLHAVWEALAGERERDRYVIKGAAPCRAGLVNSQSCSSPGAKPA